MSLLATNQLFFPNSRNRYFFETTCRLLRVYPALSGSLFLPQELRNRYELFGSRIQVR